MTNPTASEWRAIGDTTLNVFAAEFSRVSSPLFTNAAAIYDAARPHSALALAHMWAENQYSTTGLIIKPHHNNPMALRPGPGIGVPYGTITAPDGSQFLTFDHPADCVIEWRRRIQDPTYKGGVYTATDTLDEYLAVYAPAGDVHPITGADNADIGYPTTIRTMLSRYAALEQSTGDTAMATHRYVLSAGHRNTDGGGAWRGPESAWTYPICKKLKAAIDRRGGKAWIISEEDGDSDPSFSKGRGLQATARLCVDLANAVGGVDAYLSMHYGAEPVDGFFTIYPDAHSGVDVAANNPLDIKLATVFAKHVAKTGMPIRGNGLMSERKSGVGLQGYRLGEFVGTIGFRDTTARVIIEGGNSLDDKEYALLWSAAWQDKYVNALVDGLEEVFGAFPKSAPAPAPETPKETYAAAEIVPELKDAHPFLVTSGGSTFVRADLVVKATKDTPRKKYATADSVPVGPPIKAGEEFSVDYVVLNPDGSRYWYTPWGTRVAYEDTEIVRADAA